MPNTLEAWLGVRFPDVLAAYHAENEKRDSLAALERTIAEATEEARRIREELGMEPPFLDPVPDLQPKPEPKKRAPRKPKAADPAVPDVVEELGEPEATEPVVDAEVIDTDKFVTTEPATDEGDFEDFEIPADDEDDEF